jgi:hypothetical protein
MQSWRIIQTLFVEDATFWGRYSCSYLCIENTNALFLGLSHTSPAGTQAQVYTDTRTRTATLPLNNKKMEITRLHQYRMLKK